MCRLMPPQDRKETLDIMSSKTIRDISCLRHLGGGVGHMLQLEAVRPGRCDYNSRCLM